MHETSRSSLQAWDRNQHFQEDKNLKIKFLLKNTMRDCEHTRVLKYHSCSPGELYHPVPRDGGSTAPQVLT